MTASAECDPPRIIDGRSAETSSPATGALPAVAARSAATVAAVNDKKMTKDCDATIASSATGDDVVASEAAKQDAKAVESPPPMVAEENDDVKTDGDANGDVGSTFPLRREFDAEATAEGSSAALSSSSAAAVQDGTKPAHKRGPAETQAEATPAPRAVVDEEAAAPVSSDEPSATATHEESAMRMEEAPLVAVSGTANNASHATAAPLERGGLAGGYPVTTCAVCGLDSTTSPLFVFDPLPFDRPCLLPLEVHHVALHLFCGKTANISFPHRPSVPQFEISTKAGLKHKHGIGPTIEAALQSSRTAWGRDGKEYYLVSEFEARLEAWTQNTSNLAGGLPLPPSNHFVAIAAAGDAAARSLHAPQPHISPVPTPLDPTRQSPMPQHSVWHGAESDSPAKEKATPLSSSNLHPTSITMPGTMTTMTTMTTPQQQNQNQRGGVGQSSPPSSSRRRWATATVASVAGGAPLPPPSPVVSTPSSAAIARAANRRNTPKTASAMRVVDVNSLDDGGGDCCGNNAERPTKRARTDNAMKGNAVAFSSFGDDGHGDEVCRTQETSFVNSESKTAPGHDGGEHEEGQDFIYRACL